MGTTDLDFCLSLALVDGDTAEYERIEKCLRAAGYQSAGATGAVRAFTGLLIC